MGRLVLVVMAAVAVGIAAVVDAVRGDGAGERSPSPDALRAEHAQLVGMLSGNGVRGVLVYTGADCGGLRARRLPDLAQVPPPSGPDVRCTIAVSPDGRRLASGAAAWNRTGSAYAICRGARVDVFVPPGARPRYAFDGCAPAWRPVPRDPRAVVLTVARAGRLLEVYPSCEGQPPCERELLGPRELERAAREHLNSPDVPGALSRVDVLDNEWLSPTRVVLLLRLRYRDNRPPPQQQVAFFEQGRLVAVHPVFGEELERLKVAPGGRYVAGEPNLLLLRDGREVHLPNVTGIHAIAWSPDGRWTAFATRASVALVRTRELGAPSPRLIRLPLAVRDLAWRSR